MLGLSKPMEQFAAVADIASHTFVAVLYDPTEQLGAVVAVASHSLDAELYVPNEQLSPPTTIIVQPTGKHLKITQVLSSGLKNELKLVQEGSVVIVDSHKSVAVLSVPEVHVADTVISSSHWFVAGL